MTSAAPVSNSFLQRPGQTIRLPVAVVAHCIHPIYRYSYIHPRQAPMGGLFERRSIVGCKISCGTGAYNVTHASFWNVFTLNGVDEDASRI